MMKKVLKKSTEKVLKIKHQKKGTSALIYFIYFYIKQFYYSIYNERF